MNAEIEDPVEILTNAIATARTFADLHNIRHTLKHTIGIVDEDRRALETACAQQEQSIIRLYLPGL